MATCDRPGLMPLNEGIAKLLAAVSGQARTETVALAAAANRVLAEDVFAPAPVPGFDNSAIVNIRFNKCFTFLRLLMC